MKGGIYTTPDGCVKNLPVEQEKLPPVNYVRPMLSETLRCAALVLIITDYNTAADKHVKREERNLRATPSPLGLRAHILTKEPVVNSRHRAPTDHHDKECFFHYSTVE
jgi:hypothetical protein